ncbi:hypothetical protein [Arenimonas sp.]|uniref:hypothetical protein n=1 Tax=Arenimonas sp. TaxID=1872635 RepID=UPI0035AE2A3D
MKKTLIAFLLAATPVLAFAAQESQLALSEGDFAEQRAVIEKDLADGKTYAEIASNDRAQVREALDRISRELEGVDSVAELAEPAKVTVFNEQERINTILTQARDDSRLVCERSRPTGSHRHVTRCQTVAERRRLMEDSRERLHRQQNSIHKKDAMDSM